MSTAGFRRFRGSLVALPTPFREGAPDEIDYPALQRLIELHVHGDTSGLVVAGTTGEAATLSDRERAVIVEYAVGIAGGRLPVLAGVGTNSTRVSCELAVEAERAGADGLLAVTPYYNRPTQRGLLAHFGAIAGATSLPVVLYNVPPRTSCDLLPDTAAAIAEAHPNVVAIKEAANSRERLAEHARRGRLDVLVGDDPLIADGMQLGAVGAIGVVGNVLPRECAELVRQAGPGGDHTRAARIVEHLAPLVRALFLETNPVPVKTALSLLGLCSREVRLPLVPLEARSLEALQTALRAVTPG